MAGGAHAEHVACMTCIVESSTLVKATRVGEGIENDHYRCARGHTFGVDWRGKPPTEPQWPPPAELIAMFGPPSDS